MTTNFCVVGSPIEHSLSPVLHAAAYHHLGLDYQYTKHEVVTGGLRQFVRAADLNGISVTMPLKREAFALASSHDEDSLLTGVSNTLVNSAGVWSAYNTDVYGISQALAGVSSPERTIVIGSGATARSGMVALSKFFPKTHVEVIARNEVSKNELVDFAGSLGLIASTGSDSVQSLLSADLVMSLVPAGSLTDLWDAVRKDSQSGRGILFDVAYSPWPSTAGLSWDISRVISGIEMLIWQAIKQVELFSVAAGSTQAVDRHALYEVMKGAVSAK